MQMFKMILNTPLIFSSSVELLVGVSHGYVFRSLLFNMHVNFLLACFN